MTVLSSSFFILIHDDSLTQSQFHGMHGPGSISTTIEQHIQTDVILEPQQSLSQLDNNNNDNNLELEMRTSHIDSSSSSNDKLEVYENHNATAQNSLQVEEVMNNMENLTNMEVNDDTIHSKNNSMSIMETMEDLTRPVLASFVTGSMKEFLFNVRLCLVYSTTL